MNKNLILFTFLITFSICSFGQISVGKKLGNVKLKDTESKEMELPFFGQKVIAIFYNDPDVKDVNDPLTEAIRSHHYPLEKYAGIGVANCDDTWLPNAAIKYAAKQKKAKYPNSLILLDESKILSTAWEIKDTNEKGVVVIIGKDQKVKFYKSVKNHEESKAIINSVIAVLEAEMKILD